MRSARLSTARRASMLALAISASFSTPAAALVAQRPDPRVVRPGAIYVQAVDTSINPISAEIIIPAFAFARRLSDEGAAIFVNIPDGLYLVQARRLGYRPEWRLARIQGDTARLEFVLPPFGVGAGSLADARLREFLRRTGEMHVASFITRAEIDRRRPRNLSVLLSRTPEISVDGAGPGPSVVRSRRATRPDCAAGMLLFVDGMLPDPPRITSERLERTWERSARNWIAERVSTGGSRGADRRSSAGAPARQLAGADPPAGRGRPSAAMSPLDWVPMSLVGAVEIYPTLDDVPAEFRIAGAECGAVLVWTRRG